MPNRILRDYTNSEKVNKLSYEAEVFFVRLMMKADDYGRFYGNPKLLKSNLFPHRVDFIKDAQILKWKQECVELGLLNNYSSNEKEYVEIIDFRQRLRLMVSKFPIPPSNDGQMTVNGQSNDGVKRSRNEVEVEVETETEVETKSKSVDFEIYPTFEDFWILYDKKVDRELSQKKYEKLTQAEKEKILIHIEHYKQIQPDSKFRKNPSTYLNQKTFNDPIEPISQNNAKQSNSKNGTWLDFAREVIHDRQANSGGEPSNQNS
jgi:hypothetical protein